jgi:methylated-DNA-[protein]-cysteine S-methyltransferase
MAANKAKPLTYVVFRTCWGYFGLAGTEHSLIRAHLPGSNCNRVVQRLTANLGPAGFDANYLPQLQQRITDYYKGTYMRGFTDVRVNLHGISPFAAAVLRACRQIKPGRTVTYGQLAKTAGRAGAGRAVGTALAHNPLPLIIPCHRVIRSDGQIGGFSSPGGVSLKRKMLEFEWLMTANQLT